MTSASLSAALLGSLVLALLPLDVVADDGTPARAGAQSPDSRVRGLDPVAREMLRLGASCSPAIAALVEFLQASDLIVGVEARPLDGKRLGEMRVVAAAPGVRYVRIAVRAPNTMQGLVSVLGHELRHATEIADASEVRDTASQRRFYLAIGHEGFTGGLFETEAALEEGRIVEGEMAACTSGPQ